MSPAGASVLDAAASHDHLVLPTHSTSAKFGRAAGCPIANIAAWLLRIVHLKMLRRSLLDNLYDDEQLKMLYAGVPSPNSTTDPGDVTADIEVLRKLLDDELADFLPC